MSAEQEIEPVNCRVRVQYAAVRVQLAQAGVELARLDWERARSHYRKAVRRLDEAESCYKVRILEEDACLTGAG